MYLLQKTFDFLRSKEKDPNERLFVSTIVMSVEEQNTAVKKTMQMQKQIKSLSEKFDGLPDLLMDEY